MMYLIAYYHTLIVWTVITMNTMNKLNWMKMITWPSSPASTWCTWLHIIVQWLFTVITWPSSPVPTWCSCTQAQLPGPLSAPRPCSLSLKIYFGWKFVTISLKIPIGSGQNNFRALDLRKMGRTYGTETPSAENLIASVFETKREIPQRRVITSLRQQVSILLLLRFVPFLFL